MSASVSLLGDSGWLIHIQNVLAGAAWIAARVAVESASVLVHCRLAIKLHHHPTIYSDTIFYLCEKIKMHLFEAEDSIITAVSICLLFNDSYSLYVFAQ